MTRQQNTTDKMLEFCPQVLSCLVMSCHVHSTLAFEFIWIHLIQFWTEARSPRFWHSAVLPGSAVLLAQQSGPQDRQNFIRSRVSMIRGNSDGVVPPMWKAQVKCTIWYSRAERNIHHNYFCSLLDFAINVSFYRYCCLSDTAKWSRECDRCYSACTGSNTLSQISVVLVGFFLDLVLQNTAKDIPLDPLGDLSL